MKKLILSKKQILLIIWTIVIAGFSIYISILLFGSLKQIFSGHTLISLRVQILLTAFLFFFICMSFIYIAIFEFLGRQNLTLFKKNLSQPVLISWIITVIFSCGFIVCSMISYVFDNLKTLDEVKTWQIEASQLEWVSNELRKGITHNILTMIISFVITISFASLAVYRLMSEKKRISAGKLA